MYQGPLDPKDNDKGTWTVIDPTPLVSPGEIVLNTICHSTSGKLVVGNYDTTLVQGRAFVYDITAKKYTELTHNGAKSITAYGVWHNTGNHYTICGGFTDLTAIDSGLDSGHLVDYNKNTGVFSNWTSFSYNNEPVKSVITHFDGISGPPKRRHKKRGPSKAGKGYTLTGNAVTLPNSGGKDGEKGIGVEVAFYARVKRHSRWRAKRPENGEFKRTARWSVVEYPKATGTSGNSVAGTTVIGVYSDAGGKVNGYISK